MTNQALYTVFLVDLSLAQQEHISGGQNPNDENGSGDKYKDKDKEKQKDKNITNFLIQQSAVNGSGEINLSISM